jgi:hypothetical protein
MTVAPPDVKRANPPSLGGAMRDQRFRVTQTRPSLMMWTIVRSKPGAVIS